jgi:hypothetical protein
MSTCGHVQGSTHLVVGIRVDATIVLDSVAIFTKMELNLGWRYFTAYIMNTYTQATLNNPNKELLCFHKNGVKTYFTCVPQKTGFWNPEVESWHCIQGKWEKMGTVDAKTIEVCHWADPHKYYPKHSFYQTSVGTRSTDGKPYTGESIFGLTELVQTEPK